jgi:CRISPR-associated protein Csm5
MKYRVTCLTPTLVGDGNKLSSIDYMVWKDHINVLDQNRIFRLLSKGPRLEPYLAQLKKADRLSFTAWGGFAQNFADRRVAFEHASSVPAWEATPAQGLFIPTFAALHKGAYLPSTAIKGALRTAAVFDRWSTSTLRDLQQRTEAEGRLARYATLKAEEAVIGSAGKSLMRSISAADSGPVAYSNMRIYLIRSATLIPKGDAYELGWKSPRGTSDGRRIEEAIPTFAEMAAPGTRFDGLWKETSERDRVRVFHAANRFALAQIAAHKQYAQWTALAPLTATLTKLETEIRALPKEATSCVVNIGWGGGLLSKVAADTGDASYRGLLKGISLCERALRTGQPFPKTRRIIFQQGKAAQLAGFVRIDVE